MENKQICGVVLSPNPVKTTERLNRNGDVIDPRTKQVITPRPAPPPTPPEAPVTPEEPKDDGLGVLDEISATKKKLKDLEELKKLKIAQKKKELELLEN